ncbi:uncharacterized protein K02A2.6-like [Rhopilema esculentum]|uniref:uncharacterized protein K02A2.6-like n=1 Tax=Rhopilema esculentum TaxID=499914 RepID=UPI0031D9296D
MLLDGQRDETSTQQASSIEGNTEIKQEVHRVIQSQHKKGHIQTKKCHQCGGSYPHKNQTCPAAGKICHKCGKKNHFAKYCLSKTQQVPRKTQPFKRHVRPITTKSVNKAQSDSDSDFDYLYAVKQKKKPGNAVTAKISDYKCDLLVDTGASVNILDEETFSQIPSDPKLEKTTVKVYPYNSNSPVKLLGKFQATVETKKRITVATFYVTEGNSGSLLGSETSQELGLVTFHINPMVSKVKDKNVKPQIASTCSWIPIRSTHDKSVDAALLANKEIFRGIGKLDGVQIKLNIDENVTPVVQNTRRIPFHIRKQVEEELLSLEAQGIIERVPEGQATPWISQIVAVPKKDNKSIRICVDMRSANTAIKRVRHVMPTVDEIMVQLNGAKFFSKIDLSQAYHQLELHKDSRYITTFSTHIGLFQYKRLNYGTNAAAELFQHTLQEALKGIDNVRNLADDIIIFGKTRAEHDKALNECLARLKARKLTVNREKCKFLQPELSFFGMVFSEDGVKPDQKKIADLVDAPIPNNASEVRSLLGMANFSAKFIPNFADITEPLRRLTHKNIVFKWEKEHSQAFKKLKDVLTDSPVMTYFDIDKETYLIVDASPIGISAILTQSNKDEPQKVIAYASRALTPVERRYSQTEKEALSIVWGTEHFHMYLYGKSFNLITDHKPLEVIYGNPKSKPSLRIERWVLRLQQYCFKVIYKPGKDNPADFMSRHPTTVSVKENMADEYVRYITINAIPKAMTIEEVQRETERDGTLQAVIKAIKTGDWSNQFLVPYKLAKDSLTINHANGIILRGNQIVMPKSLWKRSVKLAHEGHQGLAKTKALIREKVWFPFIEKLVTEEINSCLPCQAVGTQKAPEPLRMRPMPSGPWKKLHIDFYGPLPSSEYVLVIVDAYSRFPITEIVKSTAASTIIPKLDQVFAMHGLPEEIVTDNGPPFNGDDFKRYLMTLGIKFDPSTPLWPQGNSEVERFNQPLGKAIRAACIENRNWRQELQRFLLSYRSTPHATTKIAPSELLYNRVIRGKLPCSIKTSKSKRHREAQENDAVGKEKMKSYADKRRHTKISDIKVGDTVLLKQDKKNKFSANFESTTYKVIYRKGSRVTAERQDGRKVTRKLAFSKSLVRKMMMMMICLMMTITKEQKQSKRITEKTDILLDKGECLKDMEQL